MKLIKVFRTYTEIVADWHNGVINNIAGWSSWALSSARDIGTHVWAISPIIDAFKEIIEEKVFCFKVN